MTRHRCRTYWFAWASVFLMMLWFGHGESLVADVWGREAGLVWRTLVILMLVVHVIGGILRWPHLDRRSPSERP